MVCSIIVISGRVVLLKGIRKKGRMTVGFSSVKVNQVPLELEKTKGGEYV